MLRSHEFQILDRTQIGFLFYLNFSKDLYSTAHCGDIILYLKKKFFDWRPLKPSFISIQNAASDSYEIILISNAIFLSVNILSFSTTVRYSFAISLRQRSFKSAYYSSYENREILRSTRYAAFFRGWNIPPSP